jgi:ribosomal protein L7/L12
VFLSKITDTSKRDKAAELIAKVKGCTTQEAKELTTRLVIPLAKNVSKGKAEDILNQFKKLKIFGRMTKVK